MKKFLVLLLLFALTGCTSHWANVEITPEGADFAPSSHISPKESKCVAVMNDLRVKSNGFDVNASADFQRRFISNVKDTRVFSNVVSEMPATKPERYVDLALAVSEKQDSKQGANMAKGFLIGLSIYTLTPVIPLSYDFESEMLLQATRWDGKTRQYTAKGKGTEAYHLFANAHAAGNELRAQVTNNNINALMSQLVSDADFFAGH